MKTSTGSENPALFIDTWGWAALSDRKDPAHQRARSIYHASSGRLVTTDYVLNETFTLLFRRIASPRTEQFCEGILRAGESGTLTIARISPARFSAAWRLRLRYRDKPLISFTDLTSFVVMEELGITDVLTADSHFVQVGLGFKVVP